MTPKKPQLVAETLEERVHIAVLRFCGQYKDSRFSFIPDPSYDTLNDLIVSIKSGTGASFQLSVNRNPKGELTGPVHIKHGTPDERFYKIFCDFLYANKNEFRIRYRRYMKKPLV